MHPNELFAAALVLTTYVAWRAIVGYQGRIRCLRSMPPKNHLSRNVCSTKLRVREISEVSSETTQNNSGSEPVQDLWAEFSDPTGPQNTSDYFDDPVFLAAAMDGTIHGAALFHSINSIDPSVLRAIEFSTAEHLHTLPSIDSYVHDHFFAASSLSADGWFERVTGYVTEQKAAAALRAVGHHVEVAPVANQPIWDLIVDGKHVQIKEGVSGVREFLAQHHGIEIYTSPEAAAAVKDPLVHPLQSINSADIHHVTHHSLEGMNHISHPGFHFPWITIVFSCWRESKLLINEKTTLDKAVTNLGIDAVGTGVGILGGMKAGALALSFFGPHGAAIGGFFGAIFGALGGRMVSKEIRHADFNEARKSYDDTVSRAQTSVQGAIASARAELDLMRRTYQNEFIEARGVIEQKVSKEIQQICMDFQNRLLELYRGFPGLLDDLIAQLDMDEKAVLSEFPNRGIWGLLFPDDSDHLRESWKAWFRRARKIVREEQLVFTRMEPQTLEALQKAVQGFLNQYAFDLATMDEQVQIIAQQWIASRTRSQQIAEKAKSETQQVRARIIEKFTGRVDVLHKTILETLQYWNKQIAASKEAVAREGRPLGIEF